MKIQFLQDSSVASAPPGFQEALNEIASVIDQKLLDPITVTIEIVWGGTSSLADESSSGMPVSYDSLVADLRNQSVLSPDDRSFLAALPPENPTGGSEQWVLQPAEARALGVVDPNTTETDSVIRFSSDYNWTFSQLSGTIAPDTFDFVGVALHEITHALGRDLFTPLSLGIYQAPDGSRDLTTGPDR